MITQVFQDRIEFLLGEAGTDVQFTRMPVFAKEPLPLAHGILSRHHLAARAGGPVTFKALAGENGLPIGAVQSRRQNQRLGRRHNQALPCSHSTRLLYARKTHTLRGIIPVKPGRVNLCRLFVPYRRASWPRPIKTRSRRRPPTGGASSMLTTRPAPTCTRSPWFLYRQDNRHSVKISAARLRQRRKDSRLDLLAHRDAVLAFAFGGIQRPVRGSDEIVLGLGMAREGCQP